jgi:hypothetical protein
MRLSVFVAFVLLSSSAFGQSGVALKGSAAAAATIWHSTNTGQHIFYDGHISRDTLPDYWDELASNGQPAKYPWLVLSNNSAVGHVGILPDGKLGYDLTINYKVLSHTEAGTLIIVQHERPDKIAVIGTFLFRNSPADEVPNGGFFEPEGNWQITELNDRGYSKTLVVEPLSENDLPLPKKQKHKFQFSHQPRDWKNLDDSEFMRGIYVGYRKSEVWIMDADSEITKKRLFELSKSDQEFIRSEIKEGRRDHLIPEYLGESAGDAGDQRGTVENRVNSRKNARRRTADPQTDQP